MTMTDQITLSYRDICLPFSLENRDIKGRIVRLDHTLDQVLKTHAYAEPVSTLLGEVMLLSTLLGSMMKYDGILTIQIKTEGAIRFLVSDFATDGTTDGGVIRGYAQYDADAVAQASQEERNAPIRLLGGGYMAITLDQGRYMDRYQGIVHLKGESLAEAAEEYFQTSEQLRSHVKVVCRKEASGQWRGAAIIIQHLARSSEQDRHRELEQEKLDEDWRNASTLLASLTEAEMLNPDLSLQEILFRLYHEGGVRVYEPVGVRNGCRCSEDKLRQVLSNFSREDLEHMAQNGIITMDCEFCKTSHQFELNKLIN